MTIERTELVWVETQAVYTSDDLVRLSGLPQPIIDELVACGALPAAGHAERTDAVFETECVVLARAASRLREHFELDDRGLAVAVSLLRRVRLLEARIARVAAQPEQG